MSFSPATPARLSPLPYRPATSTAARRPPPRRSRSRPVTGGGGGGGGGGGCTPQSCPPPGPPKPTDRDGDGVADSSDNCPDLWNTDQGDADADQVGNACDTTVPSDFVNGTLSSDGGSARSSFAVDPGTLALLPCKNAWARYTYTNLVRLCALALPAVNVRLLLRAGIEDRPRHGDRRARHLRLRGRGPSRGTPSTRA